MNLEDHFDQFDFDVRKSKDARFMDQKVTPDVFCLISDCVLNYVANRDITFTKDDIWNDDYFNTNVKNIFNKPDAQNSTTKQEYDKFTSQPLRTLAYSGILSLQKRKNKNYYKVVQQEILEFIGMKTRNAYIFLYNYLLKVLEDCDILKYFDDFKNKNYNNTITKNDFYDLKTRFQKFIIGNTPINGITEINRIFPKILNVYSCENNIMGTIGGRLSNRQIYYTDLMYNRPNWRDVDKHKNISRNESISEYENLLFEQNAAYSSYQVQKAMKLIRDKYSFSEVRDQWANGNATQVHHIFPKSDFRQLSPYLENLIKLTPTQHYTKAHPDNNTQLVNLNYQLICLLAKSDNIEKSIRKNEFIYSKESFIYVINTGLSVNLKYDIDFNTIKKELTIIYNII